MLASGTVRIGTLHSYRATELGPAIGDPGEGIAVTWHMFDTPTDISKAENRSWVTDQVFEFEEGEGNVTFAGLSLVVPERAPDCFIYCATEQFSREAMAKFKTDACVEIHNPSGFARTLADSLSDVVSRRDLCRCDYSGRSRNERMKRVPPALVKDPQYSYQKEVRLLLSPRSPGPIAPLVTSIPQLIPFCRLLSA